MKKFLIIPLLALMSASTGNASAVKPLPLNQYCFRQAANLYGDMLDCGISDTRAMSWALNRYDNCVAAMSN